MKSNSLSIRDMIIIGFMLFALFFGAGNLVFPPMLGQSAGTNVWLANLGFLITGVGLPLITVMALGFSGKPDLLSLSKRVHPLFGYVFTTALYLSIGPLFAMPRTGSVSFEVGIKQLIPDAWAHIALILFAILYFGVSLLFSLNPSRIIDIVGKILTPLLITVIAILAIAVIMKPLGVFQAPVEPYIDHSFFSGFEEGYLTMDALAAFVFGIIIIEAIRDRGATTKKQLLLGCLKSALISATLLALIYTLLSYLGATSAAKFGEFNNGGELLAVVTNEYFGSYGGIVLGLIVLLACLTTSIGLTTSCSTYLHKLMPAISYRAFAIGLSVFSAVLTTFGLQELISISVPVLTLLYPIAIILMILTFLHPLFRGKTSVYYASLLITFIISLISVVGDLTTFAPHDVLVKYLPLYEQGLGWLIPALVGGAIGMFIPSSSRS